MNVRSVLSGLLLLSLTSRAQGIKCYECKSNSMVTNVECEMGVSRSKPQTCPPTTKFCDYVKIKLDAGLVFSMIYRGCGEESAWIPNNVGFEDKKLGIATLSYRSCNKDLCNGDVWDKSLYNNSKDSHSCDAHLLLLALLTSLCLVLSF